MGFFGVDIKQAPKRGPASAVSVELLRKAECKACPLNYAECNSPKMQPLSLFDDAGGPVVYILGANPSTSADKLNKPFAGEVLDFMKMRIPSSIMNNARWNNITRTHAGSKGPTQVAIECCRPSIVRDIEETKPVAIITFGALPLKWVCNETHPNNWMGRRIPVKIGSHTCWLYPFVDPERVLRMRRWEPITVTSYPSDMEFAFAFYMRRAAKEIRAGLPKPVVHDRDTIFDGVSTITGKEPNALKLVRRALERAKEEKINGFDYETNALRPYNKQSKLLSFGVAGNGWAVGVALNHRQAAWSKVELEKLYLLLSDYLYDEGPRKIAHQLAFEMEWSAFYFGSDVLRASKWGDSISQAYVINETPDMLSLASLTMQYFGFDLKEISKVDRKNLDDEQLDKVLPYNALDAKYHRLLYIEQRRVIKEQGRQKVYAHQLRRIPTLVLTQLQGLPIDQKVVGGFKERLEQEVAETERKLERLPSVRKFERRFGAPYRPGASRDAVKMLRMLGARLERTEKGSEKADEASFKQIEDKVGALTIKWRKASKLLSTYIMPVSPGSPVLFDDGRIHPIISTYKVQTWRTSSEEPNSQNWPNRGPNRVIRGSINPGPGYRIVSFDYAGIQARNVAMESKDPALVKAFIDHYDIHSDFTEIMLRKYPRWVKEGVKTVANDKALFKAYRNRIKNEVVFPTFFGAKKHSVARSLGVSEDIAEYMRHRLIDRFPQIDVWHKRINRDFRRLGYVTGHSGFRRHAPVAQNQLINAPIQADESIIVLTAMCALSEIDPDKYQAAMEIHDDLTFIMPVDEIDERAEVIITEMTRLNYDWINVPLVIEMAVGKDWASLEDVAKFESKWEGGYRQI